MANFAHFSSDCRHLSSGMETQGIAQSSDSPLTLTLANSRLTLEEVATGIYALEKNIEYDPNPV
ncbi:MAG: hypothetical protein AAGF26_02955, partial [Cyanobacteria bacterium P01_G01_bin.49]